MGRLGVALNGRLSKAAWRKETRTVRMRLRYFVGLIVVITGMTSACGGPQILSDYGSFCGSTAGNVRNQPHNGVDIAGVFLEPVLAVANGRVIQAGFRGWGCGVGVTIRHAFGLNTVYCHLHAVSVEPGARVKRGQPIGVIGMSGDYGELTHVHLILEGANKTYDPMKYIVGCYEPGVEYPAKKIVLTYPVVCQNR